jgi:hypothetical protein
MWVIACAGAPEAAAPETEPCEAAWREMAAVEGALDPLVEASAPDRDRFVTACRRLPEPARPCLSMARLLADPTCEAALDAVPPSARAALEAAMAPLDGPPPPH